MKFPEKLTDQGHPVATVATEKVRLEDPPVGATAPAAVPLPLMSPLVGQAAKIVQEKKKKATSLLTK
jgi:hypothetical protein